ncbi:hypothetical protein F0562_031565 [Nyssa sinensis]|uniref:Uncharacterized protein n=1 Tax=Nyssa sinensis TaxID=561372 RepID=A0A5J5AUV5_9ASTE|nr:hypothetical protein F0562_031565 [Nyssa sinensis]
MIMDFVNFSLMNSIRWRMFVCFTLYSCYLVPCFQFGMGFGVPSVFVAADVFDWIME